MRRLATNGCQIQLRYCRASITVQYQHGRVRDGKELVATEGAYNILCSIENMFVSYSMYDPGILVGFRCSAAWITDCFFDELAMLAGKDPLKVRLDLMADHPRQAGVLKLEAGKAGWDKPVPAGRAHGIAVDASFRSYVTQVAEVSINHGQVRVHRITCAVGCGSTDNHDTIRAQMDGAIIFALTSTLKGEITIQNGRTLQGDFDNDPLLLIDETPGIDVHIFSSSKGPGGIGEPGVSSAAAVANPVFALTGKPVHSRPVRLES